MTPLPVLSGEEACRALERAGFSRKSQKGSHVKMRHPDGRSAIVPLHAALDRGTLRGVLRQARISPEEFGGLI